jgi:hypothetical protein
VKGRKKTPAKLSLCGLKLMLMLLLLLLLVQDVHSKKRLGLLCGRNNSLSLLSSAKTQGSVAAALPSPQEEFKGTTHVHCFFRSYMLLFKGGVE